MPAVCESVKSLIRDLRHFRQLSHAKIAKRLNVKVCTVRSVLQNRKTVKALSVETVRTIRARRANGEKGKDLAAEFGISTGLVCAIHKRRIYKHV